MKTRPLSLLRRLYRNQAGVSSIMLASSFTALIGSSAFAIDLGSMYLAERRLQGIADSAAMSIGENDFGSGAQTAVHGLLVQNGSEDAKVIKLIAGTYTADPKLAPTQRFKETDPASANAMKVVMEQDVPLTFGAFVTGKHTAKVHAEAIASRRNLAAYSISTRLTNLGGNVPNQVMSALAKTNLNLTTDDIAGLSNTKIDLFAVADIIAARHGLVGRTYAEIFSASIDPAEFIGAVGEASGDPAISNLLDGIGPQLSGGSFSLSQIVDPGPLGAVNMRDTRNPLQVDALTMTRAALQLAQGETWSITTSLSVAGLAGTTLRMAGTNSTVHSPMMTITAARDVVLRSASSRLYLVSSVNTGATILPSLQVPIYVETAPGEARMAALSCATGNSQTDGVTLGVKPSIGNAAIGSVNTANFADFAQPLTVSRAQLATLPLASLQGSALLSLGGNAEQMAFFNRDEIKAATVKSVFTTDSVSSLAGSLVRTVNLTVSVLGLGVNTSALTSTAGSALSLAAPAIDGALTAAMRTTGIGLGVSDVSVDRLSCGIPLLVG